MLSRIFVALVTLSSFTVARGPIDDGKYYLNLHWREGGKERTSYALPEGDAVWTSSTRHPGANETWNIVFTHGGYTIQNVGNQAYLTSPGKDGEPIAFASEDTAPSLWRFDSVKAKKNAFEIADPKTDDLVWTAIQTEEDMVVLGKNTETPNLQFWYITKV